MGQLVSYDKMQVGHKGDGKHWTKDEVEKREQAARSLKRKSKVKLKMPAWLCDEAKKVWRKTIKEMAEFEVLDNVDAEALAVYCDAVYHYQEANDKIHRDGYTVMGAGGTEVVSPYVRAAQSYARIILQYSDKLGLNANARARLAKKRADAPEDPHASMFGD